MNGQPNLPASKSNPNIELARLSKAFWLSLLGLILCEGLVFGLLAAGMRDSKDIVAIVGPFTSVLGTVVGTFFGLQVGASGREKAEKNEMAANLRANNANDRVMSLLAHFAPPPTQGKAPAQP